MLKIYHDADADLTLLRGRKVAVLAADGFEQAELEEPMNAFKDAGAEVSIVSPNEKTIF